MIKKLLLLLFIVFVNPLFAQIKQLELSNVEMRQLLLQKKQS
jgi:hypothetical protein